MIDLIKDFLEGFLNKKWWEGVFFTLTVLLLIFSSFNLINIKPIEISSYEGKYSEILNESLEFPLKTNNIISKNKKYILNFNNYDINCIYDLSIKFNGGKFAGQNINRNWCVGDDSLNIVELEEYNLLLKRISIPENEIIFVVEDKKIYSWNYLLILNLILVSLIAIIFGVVNLIKKKEKRNKFVENKNRRKRHIL